MIVTKCYCLRLLLLTAFGKQRRGLTSYMDARNALFDMVYQETQDAPIVAGQFPSLHHHPQRFVPWRVV